ncbi:MAG TPA: hypothetical protein VEY93_08525 [Longimicrobium sp.]|nr:hypothetical protein [Longimicrobium sp.]
MSRTKSDTHQPENRSTHPPVRRHRETPEQRAARIKGAADALAQLAKMGAFDHIEDPGEWQREIREDRPLPGREY